MNGFKLFAQIVFLLPFFYAFAHAVVNAHFGFFDFFRRNQSSKEQFGSFKHRNGLQNFLFFFFARVDAEGRNVNKRVLIVNREQPVLFKRLGFARFNRFSELVFSHFESGFHFGTVFVFGRKFAHFYGKSVVRSNVFGDFRAIKPFHMRADCVFKVERPFNAAHHAHVINIFGHRIVRVFIFLRSDKHEFVTVRRVA